MTTRASTHFWIDLVSLVVMVGLAATGGLIHFVLPAGSGHFYALFGWDRHDIGQVHFYLAVAAVGLLALHVLLHWGWVCCVVGKALGQETPSRRARAAWGLVLLLGIAVFLGGGFWWATSVVQRIAPEGGGRGRRAHLGGLASGKAATAVGGAEETAASPRDTPPPAAWPSDTARPSDTHPRSSRGDVHAQHREECPAGASIDGRTSLQEAARLCGLSVVQLTARLRLPAGLNPQERLGRIKRLHGLDLQAVRGLACR